MTDTTGAKRTPERLGVPLWRRALLAAGTIGCFVVVLALAPWLARSLQGAGVPWWAGVLILLVPLVAADLLLRAALLRPAGRGRAEQAATTDPHGG
jgi:hypothetical protein